MSGISYRTEIDGLRALAILPVVFYHLGFSFFSGGFIGVDIFFVISGYLITSIITKEMQDNQFSFINFYEKRARRLMPALFAVMLFVLFASPFFLAPDNYKFLPIEIAGVLLFCSNVVSWMKSGYFSPDASERPLLHMWSLGIEEQFYLFLPIFILISILLFKKKYGLLILSLTIISFAASAFYTIKEPASSFYLLPTRFWELAVGSLCAIYINLAPKNNKIREILAFLGLILIVGSAIFFNKELVFPGYIAIIPVIGSALIIIVAERTLVGKFLSNKLFVFFGLISYSLYLWHWPLIVFSKDTYLIDLNLSGSQLFLISILFAWLSYKFIETPFRNRKKFPRNKIFSLTLLGYIVISILAAITYYLSSHWQNRLGQEATKLLASQYDYSPKRKQCHFDGGVPSSSNYCILGSSDQPNTFVWGDSHGTEIAFALSKYLPVYGVTYSSCSPGINYEYNYRPKCPDHNKVVLDFILNNNNVKNVIIASRYDNKKGDDLIEYKENINLILKELKTNGKNVIILNEVPTPKFDVPKHLAKTKNLSEKFSYNGESFNNLSIGPDVNIVRYENILCIKNNCPLYINGGSLLFDNQHITVKAADLVAKYIYITHLK